jgi:glycerol uptake facilitator-like aquaporin
MTSREQFEQEHFGISPAKVGRRYHAAVAWGPSAWRKSMKYWAALWLGIVLGAIVGGVLAVIAGVVR